MAPAVLDVLCSTDTAWLVMLWHKLLSTAAAGGRACVCCIPGGLFVDAPNQNLCWVVSFQSSIVKSACRPVFCVVRFAVHGQSERVRWAVLVTVSCPECCTGHDDGEGQTAAVVLMRVG